MEKSGYMKALGRKRILAMIAAMIAVVSLCGLTAGSVVRASTGQRYGGVSSRGAIDYGRGKVVIDSADLRILADEMDALETSVKTDIADALAEIGTYMQQDGSSNHDDKADIDPRRIVFSDLEAGILGSQSVDHLADTHASDTRGPVYYKFAKNNLLEVTADDTGMPVLIVPATEDNLSPQTAAWVDGHSFAGNGSDNYYFYQKGFVEGYAEQVGATVEYQYDDTGRIESVTLAFP